MAKSSIHIEPGNPGYFSHNSRQSFSQSQVFYDEENEIDKTKEEAFKLFRSELAPRREAYEKRVGQKLQRNTVTHLSAIINLVPSKKLWVTLHLNFPKPMIYQREIQLSSE